MAWRLTKTAMAALAMVVDLERALRQGVERFGAERGEASAPGKAAAAPHERIGSALSRLVSLALENARRIDELEQREREGDESLAALLHRLRNPLHVILGYTDLLLDGEFGALTSKQAETVRRVSQRARELADLIKAGGAESRRGGDPAGAAPAPRQAKTRRRREKPASTRRAPVARRSGARKPPPRATRASRR